MKLFVIDIYTQIWDEDGMHPIENRHLQTVSYHLNMNVKEFSKEFKYLIAMELNDGYSFNIYEFEEAVFVKAHIFFREDYEFILKYLRTKGRETTYPKLKRTTSEELIQLPYIERETSEELITELKKNFGDRVKVSESEMVWEKGASDWEANLLIWLDEIQVSVISTWIATWIMNKCPHNKPKINVIKNHSDEEIYCIVSEKSGINKNDLKIIDQKINNHDKSKHYRITSRYADITMDVSKDKEIINFKVDNKTQSRV